MKIRKAEYAPLTHAISAKNNFLINVSIYYLLVSKFSKYHLRCIVFIVIKNTYNNYRKKMTKKYNNNIKS